MCIPLTPNIEESGETQTRRRAEIIAPSNESELQRHRVLEDIIIIDNHFPEQLQIEDILIIPRMQAVVETEQRCMIDTISEIGIVSVLS